MINIEGLNKAEILANLYNNSKPQGMGILHFRNKDMTINEAEELLKQTTDFDYIDGRVMKINLASDIEFDEWLYDRDLGQGAAQRVINEIRSKENGEGRFIGIDWASDYK